MVLENLEHRVSWKKASGMISLWRWSISVGYLCCWQRSQLMACDRECLSFVDGQVSLPKRRYQTTRRGAMLIVAHPYHCGGPMNVSCTMQQANGDVATANKPTAAWPTSRIFSTCYWSNRYLLTWPFATLTTTNLYWPIANGNNSKWSYPNEMANQQRSPLVISQWKWVGWTPHLGSPRDPLTRWKHCASHRVLWEHPVKSDLWLLVGAGDFLGPGWWFQWVSKVFSLICNNYNREYIFV